MNRTNTVLMGAVVGVAVAYVFSVFIFTFIDLISINGAERSIMFDTFDLIEGSIIPESLRDAYWSLIGFYTDNISDESTFVGVMFLIGFVWVLIGIASEPTRNMSGERSNPKEYLFTSRPRSFIKCMMIPWNSLVWLWGMKKVPVILPIVFMPFILPFAILMDILMIPLFLLLKGIMDLRIRMASKKEKKIYDKITQYAVCPKCKRNFYQPNIKCKCGLIVQYPVPDVHGVSYHTCNKGHKLPCRSSDGGRSKLQAICPFCKRDIKTRDAKPLVISMVGAVGAGKTTMMLSAVESISVVAKGKGIVTEIASEGISPEAQALKGSVISTVSGELDSEYFFIRSRDLSEKEVLINDISGREFEPDGDKILFEEYYKYNDGIIFVIDPVDVVAVHNSQSPTKGSKTTPVVTLESFYHMYTEVNGYGPNVKSTVPFAVVLTKMDSPRVRAAVNSEETPEEFLNEYGQEAFVKIVKSAFANVKFFTVSSLGEDANAMEPFKWILTENDVDLKSKLF